MNKNRLIKTAVLLSFLPFLFLLIVAMLAPKVWRNSLAEFLFKRSYYQTSEELYRKNLQGSSGDSVAIANFAKTQYKRGDYTAAYDSLRRIVDSQNSGTDLLYDLGNVSFQLEDYQSALNFYRAALLRNPNDYDLKSNYELTLRKLNQDQAPKQGQDQQQSPDQDDDELQQNQEDIKNLLDALDQKESLDRRNQQNQQQHRSDKWW